jgi:4-alpha-glucanotransferase
MSAELAEHERALADWIKILTDLGLLQDPGSDREIVAALHAFLARTPARLIGISLADAVGERRTQNQPGTTDEYPNWRVPLADAEGRAVLLDDLRDDPTVRATVTKVIAEVVNAVRPPRRGRA